MEQFGLIGTIKDYADAHGNVFLCGDQWVQNYEATQADINPGQIVIGADFKAIPTFSTGQVTEIRYQGGIILGRKLEIDTDSVSNLDETYYQKYINRLKDLSQLLALLIIDLSCDNNLTVENVTFAQELNKFDTNIDFIAATLTFVQ